MFKRYSLSSVFMILWKKPQVARKASQASGPDSGHRAPQEHGRIFEDHRTQRHVSYTAHWKVPKHLPYEVTQADDFSG